MLRDFSESSKQNLKNLISGIETEKYSDFTDWVDDRWCDYEDWINRLGLRGYINNVNTYHKKVIEQNNAAKDAVDKIFDDVKKVNNAYYLIFKDIEELIKKWQDYIDEMDTMVTPGKGKFNTTTIESSLDSIVYEIESCSVKCIKDRMVQNIGGELVFDEELIYEYIQKDPAEMTDAEQQMLVDVIAELKNVTATYETLATYGTDNAGVDILNQASWVSESKKYSSFTAVSAHYNEIYVNLLNRVMEASEDSKTFASSLVKISNGESTLDILGTEYSKKVNDIFGNETYTEYFTKYTSEHSEQYFLKADLEEDISFKTSGEFKDVSKRTERISKKSEKWLEEQELLDKKEKECYIDSDGNVISENDAPKFYDKQATIAEIKGDISASANLYDGTFVTDDVLPGEGKVSVTVGEAEAHASISGGFYVIGTDGEKKFSPGVNAEIGASITALEVEWDQQWFGNEMIGFNTDIAATAGKAEAKADIGVQVFGEDGKLNVQLGASASAEAIALEVEGSAGVNVLGGEIGVSGSVNVGIGAHADVGYKDGVFKFDVGASLGVGFSFGFEVDVGGMVDTVTDMVSSAWDSASETVSEAWDTVSDAVSDAWDEFCSWW